MSKYKANHNLLMPDGKTEVSAGQIFEYNGDTFGFEDVIVQVDDNVKADVIVPEAKTIHRPEKAGETIPANDKNPNKDPEGKEEAPAAFGLEGLSDEEIRAQGKAWKIKNYHSMGIENLKKKIYEAYASAAPDAPEELKKPDAGFEVDNVPETPANDGEANA